MTVWGSRIEKERLRRIKISVWAWSYEKYNRSIVPDSTYDEVCKLIDPRVVTGNDVMDKFFLEEFSPDTGLWIHKHPNTDELDQLYLKHYQ